MLKTPERDPEYELVAYHRPIVLRPVPRLPCLRGFGKSHANLKFNIKAFKDSNKFFDSAKNPYDKPRITSDHFWNFQQATGTTVVFCTTRTEFFNTGTSLMKRNVWFALIWWSIRVLSCSWSSALHHGWRTLEWWDIILQFYANLHISGQKQRFFHMSSWMAHWRQSSEGPSTWADCLH